MTLTADDHRHGTTNGYTNLKCRCQPCRDAWAAECRRMKANRMRALTADDPRHGKASTYGNYSCRCEPCARAWAVRYGHWFGGNSPRTSEVTPPRPPRVSRTSVARWLYANSAESGKDIRDWCRVGGSPIPSMAARGRGYATWSMRHLDRLFPDLTLAGPDEWDRLVSEHLEEA